MATTQTSTVHASELPILWNYLPEGYTLYISRPDYGGDYRVTGAFDDEDAVEITGILVHDDGHGTRVADHLARWLPVEIYLGTDGDED